MSKQDYKYKMLLKKNNGELSEIDIENAVDMIGANVVAQKFCKENRCFLIDVFEVPLK